VNCQLVSVWLWFACCVPMRWISVGAKRHQDDQDMDIQSPDLSGKLKVALEKALEEGKQLKLQGKAVDAAAKYEAAHKMALQLKDYAKTREEEREYIARSVKYRKHAEDLREGRAKVGPDALKPPPPPGEPRPAGRKKAKEREEVTELKQTVQGLIQIAKVGWDDIGGLDEVKQEIKFALGIWLAQAPEKPGGKKVQLQSWRNMLFYGPPGTGKTLLAGAASRALKTREDKGAVFFNVKVSSVLSKYFGESSKIVSELYGTARDLSPSVVFLDEFESLAADRDQGGGDTGAERRILSTILAELDGLAEKGRTDIYVLTIAATNRPWDLDDAVLSRFDKKILIPLPDPVTRRAILEIQIGKKGLETRVGLEDLVAMTDGCSGRELERFCKEAQTRMVREMNTGIPALVDQGIDAIRGHTVRIRPLTREDFGSPPKPQTNPQEVKRYFAWRDENT